MRGRRTLLAGLTVVAALAFDSAARADHHLVQIREVYPGTNAAEDEEFVELQMYAAGQGQFQDFAYLRIFGADGLVNTEIDNFFDASFQGNQRTFLIGNDPFGVVTDIGYNADHMESEGGAVCFGSTQFSLIDCVAWGAITNPPASAGTLEAAIPDGSSLDRTIARGCPTLLDAADDTNSTAADFAPLAGPTPRNNSTAPIEQACPNTRFTKKPKKVTTKRRAVFKFTATPAAASFECKLDDKPFKPCTSPFRKRVGLGKHKFKVRAEGESSPASHRWKVVED